MKERNFPRKDSVNKGAVLDLKAVNAQVTNVRSGKYGTTFTLKCDGFSLYNLKVVERKDGGYFIAAPSHKGSNDKYYSDYALYLSESDVETILDAVEEGGTSE